MPAQPGDPATNTPPPETWPYHAPDEIEAATRVLASGRVNYWTGDEGRLFEREFADYHGVPYGVALANGTVGLEAALVALGIGPSEDVVIPPRTFVATGGAVVLRGARPVFADVDRDSGTVTAATVEAALTPCTRAVIAVHLGGWPCDMGPIMELARQRGLKVIEDCAQSHGARYRDRLTGSFGNVGVFSFCQDKIITTGGEGGMLITADEDLWQRAWSAKDHGKSWDAVQEPGDGSVFRWLHHSFGSNWRLTEVQAAIGRFQLRKLDGWVEARRANARILAEGLAGLAALRIPTPRDDVHPSYYRFYAYIRPDALRTGWTRDRILQGFAARGIPALSGSCSEIYLERAFADSGLQPAERLPVARELGETSIAFPVHPTLRVETLEHWVDGARSVLTAATR
jgi:dTDP-4-amino-4,6-dideoxygalactose transaminase